MKCALFVLLGLVLIAGVAYAQQNDDEPVVEPDCPQEECGDYEEYRCCGSCFQESCITKKMKCQNKCTTGCFCQEGFIREFEGGKCMPQRLCQNYYRKGFGGSKA